MHNPNHDYLKSMLLAGAFLAAASAPAFGQTTLAQWTFETSQPVTAGPFAPEVGSGSALGSHASTSTVYSTPAGNGSAHSFSSTNWAIGDYYQFEVSTIGVLSGIGVFWDQTSSNTGPGGFKLSYSTNGSTFTDFASYSVLANATPNTPWSSSGSPNSAYTFTYDLSSISTLDNQATVYFRLIDNGTVSANGGTIGTAGTDRMDNFTITAIPEPSTYALLIGLAGFGVVLWRRNERAANNSAA
jgi:hypothetical protein